MEDLYFAFLQVIQKYFVWMYLTSILDDVQEKNILVVFKY